jgi:hypothetical protein
VPTQGADGRIGQQAVQLALGSAQVANGLRKSERVSDPPDYERTSDDVLLVPRKHLRVAGLVHAPAQIEPGGLIDGPGEFPVQARLRGGPQRTSEASDKSSLPFPDDHGSRVENDGRER